MVTKSTLRALDLSSVPSERQQWLNRQLEIQDQLEYLQYEAEIGRAQGLSRQYMIIISSKNNQSMGACKRSEHERFVMLAGTLRSAKFCRAD